MLSIKEIEYFVNALDGKIKMYSNKEMIPVKQYPDEIGIILSGIVYLCTENESYEFSLLDYYRLYDVIDYNMMIPIENGICYFLCKHSSKIAWINREKLYHFYNEYPKFRDDLSHLFFHNFRENCINKYYLLHQKSIRSKIITYLHNEAKIQGTDKIILPIPYNDLALYLSVDRTALMKEIHNMKEDGILSGKNHELSI